jgi:hypothetical protein
VQLYDTTHVARITPTESYLEFRAAVRHSFTCYITDSTLDFTLHYYPIEDDPISKVKFDHVDSAATKQLWLEYLRDNSEATIVLFIFRRDATPTNKTPTRERLPKDLRISVPAMRQPGPFTNTSGTSGTPKERVSPTLSGKAKTRDGRMCVMCGIAPVQPYGAHIIPHGDDPWLKHVPMMVPPELAWFVEQTVNIVTMCDDCHKLFDTKAALWVEVDASTADPARRLKIVLQEKMPDSIAALMEHCKKKFPADQDHFVRVPLDLHDRSCFPCWPTYDALWHWRLNWSQTKHALMCQKEEETLKHEERKASWDGKCVECKKKGNGICPRLFCKPCCGKVGGCSPAKHPDTSDALSSAAADASDNSGIEASLQTLRLAQ